VKRTPKQSVEWILKRSLGQIVLSTFCISFVALGENSHII